MEKGTHVHWEDTRQPVERGSECRATHTYTLATALTPLYVRTYVHVYVRIRVLHVYSSVYHGRKEIAIHVYVRTYVRTYKYNIIQLTLSQKLLEIQAPRYTYVRTYSSTMVLDTYVPYVRTYYTCTNK